MALRKTFTDNDFRKFEGDLLSVLKNDGDHRVPFDGKMLFRSRRYSCLLAATDVHWDEATGDVVLVGAYRSGSPLLDETKNYPALKKEVAVPLRECYDDLRESSGEEMRLVSKARKAVIDKYFNSRARVFDARGFFDDGIMDLESYGCGAFNLVDRKVVGIMKDEEGRYSLMCSNSFDSSHTLGAKDVALRDIQNFGERLETVLQVFGRAHDTYVSTLARQRGGDMSYSAADERRFAEAAIVAVYDEGFPPKVVDRVFRYFTDRDCFDPDRYPAKDIAAMVKRCREGGSLEPAPRTAKGRGV